MIFERTGRMTTGIERVFRPMREQGFYREIYLHWIHFMNESGEVVSSKLDKSIKGKLYRIAKGNERSMYGEVEYKFPNAEEPVRLIALGIDPLNDSYGRF